MADIYAQVLGLERVGVDDSFFDLGGDSLSATRLINAINTGLDADLAVRAVFEVPTVAQLASRVDAGAASGRHVGRWWRGSARGWSRCRLPRRRLWVLGQLYGPSPVYNMPTVLSDQQQGGWTSMRSVLRWRTWWAAEQSRCGRCSPRSRGSLRRWWCRVEDADFGWQTINDRAARGLKTSWRRPSARR